MEERRKIKYLPRTSVTLIKRKSKKGDVYHACIHGKGLPPSGVERTTKIIADGSAAQRKAAEQIAERIRQSFEEKLDSEDYNDLKEDINMIDLIDEWFAKKEHQLLIGEIRPNTLQYYKDIVSVIKPYFVKHPVTIQHVTKEYLVNFKEYHLLVANRSQRQTRKLLDALDQILDFGIKNDYIMYNQMNRIEKPRKKKHKEIDSYDVEQLNKLLTITKNTELESIVILAAYLGIRREEALGLQWSDIDFKNNYVHIRHVCTQQATEVIDEEFTKSDNGYRKIKMNDSLHQYLLDLQKRQAQEKKICGNSYYDSPFVVKRSDGTRYKPNSMSSKFCNFIKLHKMPHITLHGLRHSLQANIEQQGVPASSRARILGDDIQTLIHYDHSSQRGADQAVTDFQNRLCMI